MMRVLHAQRQAWIAGWRPLLSVRSQGAWALGLAAIVSRFLPEQVVARLGWNYVDYLWYSSIALLSTLLLLVTMRFLWAPDFRDRRDAVDLAGVALAVLSEMSQAPHTFDSTLRDHVGVESDGRLSMAALAHARSTALTSSVGKGGLLSRWIPHPFRDLKRYLKMRRM